MRKIKVHEPYGSYGYANWMNYERVNSVEECDVLLLSGGADINPALYNEKKGSRTYFNENRDEIEVAAYHEAKRLGKKIFGVCRGLQLITALNGGKLIQHTNHGGGHPIHLFDGRTVNVNSLHHQMCYPFNLSPDSYKILGFTVDRSNVFLNGFDEDIRHTFPDNFVEPEIILFGKNEFGVQYHPEMMSNVEEGKKVTMELFEKFLNDEL